MTNHTDIPEPSAKAAPPEKSRRAFFGRTDWLSFWAATAVSLGVYFFTLGPSVGMEDSGELATAGDHLGVPHPPGYPIWTMCAWVFCRVFGWVTYQGHPTPAWAISLMSAVFGALAAGCTAMLITRSARDMLRGAVGEGASARHRDLMALAGGIGGSLVFAFSPVMWSQAVIVEIYSLNALFLMWTLLLTYRWMRRPSDKILWLTAFVFGLGLTNYQVLLFAAVPLVLVILMSEIALFRDFAILLIPVGLTAFVLSMAAHERASDMARVDVIAKHWPWGQQLNRNLAVDAGKEIAEPGSIENFRSHFSDLILGNVPDTRLLWIGAALVLLAVPAAFIVKRRMSKRGRPDSAAPGGTGFAVAAAGVLCVLLSIVFGEQAAWLGYGPAATMIYGKPGTMRMWPGPSLDAAPLWNPALYALVGAFAAASIACAVYLAFAGMPRWRETGDKPRKAAFAGMCAFAAAAVLVPLLWLESASSNGVATLSWTRAWIVLAAGMAAMWLMAFRLPRGICFAVPATCVQTAILVLAWKGALTGLTDPNTWWFHWPLLWNFAILALAWCSLPNGRRVAFAALFAELGVAFYAYMPIVSDLRNPPMNWAYPRTWEGFKHALTRGQYDSIGFGIESISDLFKQVGFYLSDLRMQFTLLVATLALVPFAAWRWRDSKGREWKAIYMAAGLYLAVAGIVTVCEFIGIEPPWRIDKAFSLVLAFLVVIGATIAIRRQASRCTRLAFGKTTPPPSGNLVFAADDTAQSWLVATGAGFLMMSVVLILLANTRGDIQDGFIQKVKFISSHGIFSIWIGYGLAFGLAVANRWLAGVARSRAFRRTASAVLLVCASLAFLVPIYENYTNDDLVLAMGSAEQNGHTFGWQFGAYQLEGHRAIAPELSPDEEPLPNPDWPPPMDRGAIFFGGSDPGRFVPTYMIYSADYRPDIHLITQNALADNTYMSVERDLYGDDIWIPDANDSQEAFEDYRKNNADAHNENGRLEVRGPGEVMKVNAFIARRMFERERLRRSFYIEESYKIDWMYPYLSPHGLIMKIESDPARDVVRNPAAIPFARNIVESDMDFWDWYTRRLLRDPAFRRDFASQKNFSKLRSAIAALYAMRGYRQQSIEAFRNAMHLYPLSAEPLTSYYSQFLTRDMLLAERGPDGKLTGLVDENALANLELTLEYAARKDPIQTIIPVLHKNAARLAALQAKLRAARAKNPSASLSAPESTEMAVLFADITRHDLAYPFVKSALSHGDYNDPAGLCECLTIACLSRGSDSQVVATAASRLQDALRKNAKWIAEPENAEKVRSSAWISFAFALEMPAGTSAPGAEIDRASIAVSSAYAIDRAADSYAASGDLASAIALAQSCMRLVSASAAPPPESVAGPLGRTTAHALAKMAEASARCNDYDTLFKAFVTAAAPRDVRTMRAIAVRMRKVDPKRANADLGEYGKPLPVRMPAARPRAIF